MDQLQTHWVSPVHGELEVRQRPAGVAEGVLVAVADVGVEVDPPAADPGLAADEGPGHPVDEHRVVGRLRAGRPS